VSRFRNGATTPGARQGPRVLRYQATIALARSVIPCLGFPRKKRQAVRSISAAHRILVSPALLAHAAAVHGTRERFDCDVAIVGGGSAGFAAARTAADAGLKAVVIEGGEEVGGLCILRGCMPTKALLYAAEVMHLASHADPWGIHTQNVTFDFAKVMARKDALIKDFADDRREQLASGKSKFFRATARFRDAHTLALDSGETLTARHFIIATGSVVAPPPLPQLRQVGYLTSDTALALLRLPKSLIVLGGGPVAVEFAQFFARFGVKVTLIQRSERLLRECDTDAAREIERVFRREGIDVFTGTKLTDARREGTLKTVSFLHNSKPASVSSEEILFALGLVPPRRWI
jgi:pyruvate/2-oxoglutarate dehydrogenase complex dihydrolipoamide dehydrogenase (E3) component